MDVYIRKLFKYFCVYTKRSGSRGGRGGVYGEPATVSDMPHPPYVQFLATPLLETTVFSLP